MSISEHTISNDLSALSRKTGLVVKPVNPQAIDTMFATLEEYDATERAETFEDLKRALNATRASVGAEPAFSE
jgi:hypothetical protein